MLSASQLAAGTALMVVALPFGGLTAPNWRLDAILSLLILGTLGPVLPTSSITGSSAMRDRPPPPPRRTCFPSSPSCSVRSWSTKRSPSP